MAGMTKTKEREQVFAMSDTYYDTKVVIATKKANKITSYDQLKGKTVGVKNGTAAQRFLQKNKDKYGYTIKTFDTSDLMNNSLSTGAVAVSYTHLDVYKRQGVRWLSFTPSVHVTGVVFDAIGVAHLS